MAMQGVQKCYQQHGRAADTEVKDNQEWQFSCQDPRPAWMDAGTMACQQKDIAEVAATACCLPHLSGISTSKGVTAFSAQRVMTGETAAPL